MKIKVIKASGIIEDLDSNKLRASLIRSGAGRDQAEEIVEKIFSEIKPYTTTKEIYRLAKKYLKKYSHAAGLRYSLKKALFRLGPSGYPFEKYIGALLKHYGFQVKTGMVLKGRCVKHEIDVFAVSDKEVYIVECKYRNSAVGVTDVKVAMYVHSRFQDLMPVVTSRYSERKFSGWLVTNTRCTSDAVQYAECAGIRVQSWGYPEKASLEEMIEDRRLYPVTIISGIKSNLASRLIRENIILLKDLTTIDLKDIRKMLSLPENKALALKRQAEDLCLS